MPAPKRGGKSGKGKGPHHPHPHHPRKDDEFPDLPPVVPTASAPAPSTAAAAKVPTDAGVFEEGKLRPKEVAPPELQARLQASLKPSQQKPAEAATAAAASSAEESSRRDASGIGGEHRFWSTQPVPALGSAIAPEFNHPINADARPEDVPRDAAQLPSGYRWCTVDVAHNDAELREAYTLLCENYVEDDDAMFRFDYSPAFLRWALTPPGHVASWVVGVREEAAPGALVGFITGIPVVVRVHDRAVKMAEINFLVVHKRLRNLRLAPLLIAEVTRRVHLEGIFQAVYTAGVLLPTPVATCRYWHRSLNPKKLVDVGFSSLSSRMTIARAIKLYRLPEQPAARGIRPMRPEDVPAVRRLLGTYLARFAITPVFTEEEIAHWMLPREGVVHSFVVEAAPGSADLTGFTSFYALPSTIIGHPRHKTLNAAYFFYTVNACGPVADLVKDALIFAKNLGFDVYNCLDLMENESFLKDLKFGIGDGSLHYYIYNWATPAVKPGQIGIVLL